jgi:hypothetical protein
MAYTDWKKGHYNSQSVFRYYFRYLVLNLLDMACHETDFRVRGKRETF